MLSEPSELKLPICRLISGLLCAGCGLAVGVEDQEIGGGDVLVVRGPHALAASADRIVDHAAARERAVAEYIDHDRLVDARRVLQAGADAVAEIQIARLAVHAIAGVVVEAAHLDGAGGGIAVDDQLHDRRRSSGSPNWPGIPRW